MHLLQRSYSTPNTWENHLWSISVCLLTYYYDNQRSSLWAQHGNAHRKINFLPFLLPLQWIYTHCQVKITNRIKDSTIEEGKGRACLHDNETMPENQRSNKSVLLLNCSSAKSFSHVSIYVSQAYVQCEGLSYCLYFDVPQCETL